MATPRQSLSDFSTENAYYAGATVAVYEVDVNLNKTGTLAPLYAAPTGLAVLGNPQTLDSRGRWPQPVYVDRPVILTVTRGADIRDTGIVSPMPRWRGEWAAGQTYYPGDRVSIPASISVAVVLETHVSGVYATDLANGLLEVEIPYEAHTHTASQISDSTAAGRAVLTAANAAAQRTALGATATGDAVFTAADPAAARNALGALHRGGDTMTGALTLAGNPAADLQAVPRQYLEQVIGDLPGFRNAVINGDFQINERNALPFTASGAAYIIDRWRYNSVGGSRTVSLVQLTDADRSAIGDENFVNALQFAVTGGSAAGDFEIFEQPIENVRRFAGKTVTASFYARATSGAPFVSMELQQIHGTGGSPTATQSGIGGINRVQLSTTFQRFTATISVPSVNGRTFGTNGNDCLLLTLWLSGNNASWGSRVPGIAPQTATIQITGVQVEEGSRALPFEHRPRGVELALCQRFFSRFLAVASFNANGAGNFFGYPVVFPVQMRGVPVVSDVTALENVNASSAGFDFIQTTGCRRTVQSLAAGTTSVVTITRADSEL